MELNGKVRQSERKLKYPASQNKKFKNKAKESKKEESLLENEILTSSKWWFFSSSVFVANKPGLCVGKVCDNICFKSFYHKLQESSTHRLLFNREIRKAEYYWSISASMRFSMTQKRTKLKFSHLDRIRMVNKGFTIIWLK